jgi:carbon storage regulator
MLVLTRRKNESIVIGDVITVVVVEIRGDKIRLGIEAPREVSVYRPEIRQALRRSELWCECPGGSASMTAPSVEPTAMLEAPAPDGMRCPQCQSEDVEVVRLKAAYEGKELVRWRKCLACSYEFHSLERVALL